MRTYYKLIKCFLGVASFALPSEIWGMEATMDESSSREQKHKSKCDSSLDRLSMLTIPFDCFHYSKIICSTFLLEKHSVLIRKTLNDLFQMTSDSDVDVTLSTFQDLSEDIKKCFYICKKWDHVALPLFDQLNALLEEATRKKNKSKRKYLQTCLSAFKEKLTQETSSDAWEIQLISLYWEDHNNTKQAFNLAQLLVNDKREEVAIHYLLMLGEKIQFPYALTVAGTPHLCEETKQLYNLAEKLGSKEAKRRIEEVAKEAAYLNSLFSHVKTHVSEEEGYTQSIDDSPSNSAVSQSFSEAS